MCMYIYIYTRLFEWLEHFAALAQGVEGQVRKLYTHNTHIYTCISVYLYAYMKMYIYEWLERFAALAQGVEGQVRKLYIRTHTYVYIHIYVYTLFFF